MERERLVTAATSAADGAGIKSYGGFEEEARLKVEGSEQEQEQEGYCLSTQAVTTFKSTVGSGFFALPFAIHEAGLIPGTLIVTGIAAATVVTTKQLIHSAAMYKKSRNLPEKFDIGYLNLSDEAFGNSTWISAALIASQFIAVCTYLVFLESTLSPLIQLVVDGVSLEDADVNVELSPQVQNAVLIGSVAVQFLLALPPSPMFLERTSNFGNFAFACAVVFIFAQGLMYHSPSFSNMNMFGTLKGSYVCFGITSFTLSAHAECLSIYSVSDQKGKRRYGKVIDSVIASATTIYLAIAIFAYACFGDAIQQDLLADFTSSGGNLGVLLQLSICLMITCNFPLTLYPVHQLFEQIFMLEKHDSRGIISLPQALCRFTTIALAGIVGWFAGTRFGDVSTIGGAFIGFLGYVVPPIIYISLNGGWFSLSRVSFVVNLILITIGMVGSLQSLFQGVENIFVS